MWATIVDAIGTQENISDVCKYGNKSREYFKLEFFYFQIFIVVKNIDIIKDTFLMIFN